MKKTGSDPQGDFNFDHQLPAGMETFSVRFLATWFKCTPQHWINLVEQGAIAAIDLRSPGASKSMLRITRSEVVRYIHSKKTE
jgi:hypothetical protein